MQAVTRSASRPSAPHASGRSQPRAFSGKPVARPVLVRAVTEEVTSSNGAHAAAGVVDFEELSDIIRMVNETDIVELELKSKKFTLNLRKREALQAEQQAAQQAAMMQFGPPPPSYMPAPAPAPAAAAAPAAPTPAAAAAPPPPPPPAKIEGVEVTSPMAGTFYKAAAPGEAPFVKEGDRVKKGQTIGIVEAMKLMNEIEADASGTIVKILVDNGTPVTVGMPLMLIKP